MGARGWVFGGIAATGIAAYVLLNGIPNVPIIDRKSDNLIVYSVSGPNITPELLKDLDLRINDPGVTDAIEFYDAPNNQIRYVDADGGTVRVYEGVPEGRIDKLRKTLREESDQYHAIFNRDAIQEIEDEGELERLAKAIMGGGYYPVYAIDSVSRVTLNDPLTLSDVVGYLEKSAYVEWGNGKDELSTALGATFHLKDGNAVEVIPLDGEDGNLQKRSFDDYVAAGKR